MIKLHRFPDLEALSRTAAQALTTVAKACLAAQGRFTLALSGGSTPRCLYEVLATDHPADLPWSATHLFWGDERYVPADDPASNYRLVREALLDHVPLPPANIHPLDTTQAPVEIVAASYETTLREFFIGDWPRFDLVLLGLGDDGHTASLFPGTSAFIEQQRWVTVGEAPLAPLIRLTLTLPVLNHAARVWFLVAGTSKQKALQRALKGEGPAGAVRPVAGEVIWWVDEAAGAGLPALTEVP